MKRFKIGGVPEHFNLPWRNAIEEGAFQSLGLELHWSDMTGGTGQMIRGLETGSIEEATHRILKKIESLLKECDLTLNHIVKCSIFMTDLGQFSEMNAVYGSYFQNVPPARETVQVSKLPLDVPVEISCIALK